VELKGLCSTKKLLQESRVSSHQDSEVDNEETAVKDWRKPISNPAIKFSNFVKANGTAVSVAPVTIQRLSVSVKYKL